MRVSLTRPHIRAVIYDHDGTLLDSLDVVVAATNAVLAAHSRPAQPRAIIIAGMVHATGLRMGYLLDETDPVRQDELAAAFYTAAHACDPGMVHVYPEISATVRQLADANIIQGVLSNNQGTLVRRWLTHAALAPHFAAMIGEEDMPAPKPDPRGLVAMMAHLGLDPAQTVYVGDTVGDLHTAQAAGIACIGVTWGITPRHVLAAQDFFAVIDAPGELAALLA